LARAAAWQASGILNGSGKVPAVFNQRVRRTGSSVGTSPLRKSAAALGAIGLVGGLLFAGPAANAATPHATWAQGRFLSGSLAGLDLAKFAELTPATARNNGAQNSQEVVDPLAVSVLGSNPIALGAVRVSPDQVLDTSTTGGALSQYALAEKTGHAVGASGTVGKGGAIGPNASNPGSALTLSFDSLLGSGFSSALTDLKLQLEAVAAQATGNATTVTGDYYLDGLTLTFTSPALAKISDAVEKAVAAADAKLDDLTGRDGELAVALRGLLLAANPALDLGGSANVSITLSHDLKKAVADLLTATWGGSGVSFNVTTGKVAVDLGKLVGGDLNNLPVNTELLSGATVSKIVSTIGSNVSTLADQVVTRVKAALGNARLDVDADLKLLTDQAPVVGQLCQYEDAEGNILGELLGKLLGKLVCTPTTTILPKLETSASVDVHGTVAQVVDGQTPATVTAKVLGVPVSISSAHLLDVLGLTLGDRLFGSSGILAKVTSLVDGPLLAQANSGLLGSTGIGTVLSDILSLRVNLQETSLSGGGLAVPTNTVFTQTALRVSVAKGAGTTGLTTLSIAAASVAPTVTAAGEPGGPGNPGDPGNPVVDDPGDTTPTGDVSSDEASQGLAYTGVAVGTAIAALLALLAAGGWLAREGYRRNHPTLEP
jgi:hypothetical protein